MCGILGFAGQQRILSLEGFIAMRDTMRHRGPDADGTWCSRDHEVMLGHRRLSILDLGETGHQPMVAEGETHAIVFNGEIYNHQELRIELADAGARFRGSSDTEVLLHAYRIWGPKCLGKLRGMFACAIYDVKARQLFLARDRAGEKPLYWGRLGGGLIFSSELKAIMANTAFCPRLSPTALELFLAYGYVPGQDCILDGFSKLPPAHSLRYDLRTDRIEISRYWDVPAPDPAPATSRPELVDELQRILFDTVTEQLIADVPVGVLLSGGVDSSIVTALAASVSSKPIKTFTAGFPGHESFDESRYGRRIANFFGTDHLELSVDSSSIDLIPTLARQYDEPMADSSMIPTYLLSRAVSGHCKVVLGGDGGDELFGGYRSYQGRLRLERLRRILRPSVRSAISWAAERTLPVGTPNRNGLIGLRGELPQGIAQGGVMFDRMARRTLCPWLGKNPRATIPEVWKAEMVEPERGMPGAAMVADFRTYLTEDILVKVDRASMLCSLEVRTPFLDTRLIEFAYSRVPNALRATIADRKILLKDLARKLLPGDYDLARKQGFSIPLSHWLGQGMISRWTEECREQIDSLFSRGAIQSMVRSQSEGAYQRIFAIMIFTYWMREYGVSPSASA